MIYDKLSLSDNYAGISPRLSKALAFLREADFSKLEDGKHVIDGDKIFVNISSFMTKGNEFPEAHKKYIDIQYVIEGEEYCGVAALSEMTEEIVNEPDSDFYRYRGETYNIKLGNGYFVVLFPQDAHAPGRFITEPKPVRKAVVKVLL